MARVNLVASQKILQELTALMREREHACNARETQLASGEAALRDASEDLFNRSTDQPLD